LAQITQGSADKATEGAIGKVEVYPFFWEVTRRNDFNSSSCPSLFHSDKEEWELLADKGMRALKQALAQLYVYNGVEGPAPYAQWMASAKNECDETVRIERELRAPQH